MSGRRSDPEDFVPFAGDETTHAAQLLRGLAKQVEDLEQSREPDSAVVLVRRAQDTAVASDSVGVEVNTTPGWTWSGPNRFGEHAFGVGGWHGDLSVLGSADGFETVAAFDATTTSDYEDLFTGEFTTDDVPQYAGSGQPVYLAFAARWNELPTWEHAGAWVRQPEPDPDAYQAYVLRSDGQNSANEYFRLRYPSANDTAVGRIADPVVWTTTDSRQTDARITGPDTDRRVERRPTSAWNFDVWQ